ncbi:zinc-binding dehydrogenase [Streptomyces beijiangensis]|uniref:Zinc-binding dehydrogenase n=1 Tax=Streptomyces beijiangensis TaxID=163361 RepID=A0A939FDG0_9ACTN|nr:zinc-binding dehydrogenase [Streptomyces beijiangensis]MBO0517060.1 zinc-binding dehydrogenase [Streptomyces beijiangensis]
MTTPTTPKTPKTPTVRAIQVTEFGTPDVLRAADIPAPVPGPGEVLIQVSHIDTIFVETQIRAGWGRDFFPVQPPYVPGGALSGTVLATGPDTDPSWTGRRVVAGPGLSGAYAEQVVARTGQLVPVPDTLGLLEAAALAHDGVTATGIAEGVRIESTDRVLILGAAGGMGTLLVQLAHAAGAQVVGAARGDEKLSLIRQLGADAAVDYSDPDWPALARKALGGAGADVILDGVGGDLGLQAFALAADGARVSAHGAPSGGFAPIDPEEAGRRHISLRGIADVQFAEEDIVRLATKVLAQAAAGTLHPTIARVYPLERASEAHRAIEERALAGKAVLAVS